MPKGRHLKPDFFTDKHIVAMTPLSRLLYQGLWCYAADCGHLDDEPVELKMRILPADSCDVDALLDEIAWHQRIERKDGVIFVPKLRDHARVDKRYETTCEDCKEAADHAVTTLGDPSPKGSNTKGSRSGHDVTTQRSQRDHAGDGDGDGDGEVMMKGATDKSALAFEEFWTRYPRKVAKGTARRSWTTAAKKVEPDTLVSAAQSFADRSTGSDPKFIPHAATWLNGERWADEVETQKTETDGAWFEPFNPGEAPPAVADDPERYASWLEDRRREWREANGQ